MRARLTLLLALLTSLLVAVPSVGASPGDRYSGPYFGDGNIPMGCVTDMNSSDCYHMRTGLNALDTPKIDVLVVVPVSPFAERDARIQTQAVEMWRDGILYLAEEMGLDWLADVVEFRIAVNHIDLLTGDGTEDFSTYPLWDPEIIVISSNPVGGIGIGVDPHDFTAEIVNDIFGTDFDGKNPCHGVQNPFDFAQWEALPGFDNHHGQNTGTYYEEDCDGAGGQVCFAVNGAIDPDPGDDSGMGLDIFGLFNLVAHEIGHCLTLGHVGDALDHTSKTVPTWDIMSYTDHPEGQTKCVSTLNVEVFATWLSQYIDTTGDGALGEDNLLLANDQQGDGRNAFHIQHPRDHFYASPTGDPWDCPQPDLGVIPGDRANWDAEPARAERALTITSPGDGDTTSGTVTVTGTAQRHYDSDTSWNPHTPDGAASASMTSSGTASAVTRSLTSVVTRSWTGTLYPEQSTLGMMATGATFSLDVSGPATVEFDLTWTDDLAPNDLDLHVTGAASGSGTTGTPGEQVTLENVDGTLNMRVEPWLVLDPLGANFTLTATITGGSQDSDGGSGGGNDGGNDDENDGVPATEAVLVYANGTLIGSQDVWTRQSADSFAIDAALEPGTHTLRIDWEDRGSVIASELLTITVGDSSSGGDNGDDDVRHPSCRPHPRKGTTPPGQASRCT